MAGMVYTGARDQRVLLVDTQRNVVLCGIPAEAQTLCLVWP